MNRRLPFQLSGDLSTQFLRKLLKKVDLEKFIIKSKDGLSQILRQDGQNISGGEKQRFAIARAIYKDAEVLFFDEPTSSLDSKTASKFLDVINTFHKKKTMFMISHEIEKLKNCDKILLLNNATITEK